MEMMGKYVDDLMEMPDEFVPRQVLIMDKNMRTKVFTENRLKIIKFLKEQNPVTLQEIKGLFGEAAYKDILVLANIKAIFFSEHEENLNKSTIELNKEMILYPTY